MLCKCAPLNFYQIFFFKFQILSKCASKLPFYIKSPSSISAELLGSGLIRKSALSPNTSIEDEADNGLSPDQKIVLNTMFYYGKVEELTSLAAGNAINEALKKEISEWAVQESIDYKRAISDKTVSVFQGSQMSLSPIAENSIIQGIKLFRVVIEYLETLAKHVSQGAGRLRNLAVSVKCLKDHTKLVSRFIGFCIVPVDWKVMGKMREEHEKKKLEAWSNK